MKLVVAASLLIFVQLATASYYDSKPKCYDGLVPLPYQDTYKCCWPEQFVDSHGSCSFCEEDGKVVAKWWPNLICCYPGQVVNEYDECEDKCITKKCGHGYTFNQYKCACECSNKCQDGYKVNPATCYCECSRKCDYGYTLNHGTCTCEADHQTPPVTDPTKPPYNPTYACCHGNGQLAPHCAKVNNHYRCTTEYGHFCYWRC